MAAAASCSRRALTAQGQQVDLNANPRRVIGQPRGCRRTKAMLLDRKILLVFLQLRVAGPRSLQVRFNLVSELAIQIGDGLLAGLLPVGKLGVDLTNGRRDLVRDSQIPGQWRTVARRRLDLVDFRLVFGQCGIKRMTDAATQVSPP